MKKFLYSLLILSFLSIPAFADVGVKVNGSGHTNVTNLDFQTQTGSDLSTQTGLTRKIPVLSSTLFATGVAQGGATSVASTTAAVPVGFAYVRKVIPSNTDALFNAGTLANGTPGQILTIYVAGISPSGATTGGNYTITPTTSTGFSAIKVTAINDIVRLAFVDTTVGWVILGYDAGAASSITITLKN